MAVDAVVHEVSVRYGKLRKVQRRVASAAATTKRLSDRLARRAASNGQVLSGGGGGGGGGGAAKEVGASLEDLEGGKVWGFFPQAGEVSPRKRRFISCFLSLFLKLQDINPLPHHILGQWKNGKPFLGYLCGS